jgi:hypothetical protein
MCTINKIVHVLWSLKSVFIILYTYGVTPTPIPLVRSRVESSLSLTNLFQPKIIKFLKALLLYATANINRIVIIELGISEEMKCRNSINVFLFNNACVVPSLNCASRSRSRTSETRSWNCTSYASWKLEMFPKRHRKWVLSINQKTYLL